MFIHSNGSKINSPLQTDGHTDTQTDRHIRASFYNASPMEVGHDK